MNLIMTMMIMIIMIILTIILNLTTKKLIMDREKSSPFECGFDPKNLARLPFSLHFFLIAIVFIIFDVELTLLLPFIIIMKKTSMMYSTLCLSIFTIILIIGLFHELNQGTLNWTK
uniref:NADH-ubiquinone oxidoreductase chain 3 n=1 Tax=Trypodendron signatum TaxID=879022 RepID=A0A343A6K3_9CUCU|nr:NADH dehydrogenase subunit 3 [Trypodendron signatum]AOY40208.1 NADH dehydrogenase subunit 3 [Trypodendron signatum]